MYVQMLAADGHLRRFAQGSPIGRMQAGAAAKLCAGIKERTPPASNLEQVMICRPEYTLDGGSSLNELIEKVRH